METFNADNIIAAVLSISSLVINILLLITTFRLRKKTLGVKLIMTMAFIELLLPIVGISDISVTLIQNYDATYNPITCQTFGFLSMIIFFSQIIINSIIAIERVAKITKTKGIRYIIIPLSLLSLVYLITSIISASQFNFEPNPSNILCMTNPLKSNASMVAYYTFVSTTLIGTLIIISSYLRLAIYTNDFFKSWDFGIPINSPIITKRKWNLKGVTFKIYSILTLYTICMLGGIILQILENILKSANYQSKDKIRQVSSASILLIISGIFLNSLLVLLTHTAIREELKHMFRKY